MALELRQSLKLSQQLVMTPQLQQAIKLLQLSRLELQQAIREEIEKNLCSLSPQEIVRLGIAHVPEGRRLFARLTVKQNLTLGAYTDKSLEHRQAALKNIFKLFPVLQERQNQQAGTLSGGEQQMLAIARGLMSKPKLLMLDEPSMGIMPKLITEIFEMIQRLNQEEGLTILLVEQNVQEALELAHYAYVLQTGRIVMEGKPADLLQTDMIKKAYLGL